VCPWNRFATASRDTKMAMRAELAAPKLADLAMLDDATFRQFFAATPVKRTGRDRFVRNVLIAIGNSGDVALVEKAQALLDDPAPIVRGAAVWALSRLLSPPTFEALRKTHLAQENDATVCAEWQLEPVA
jgi:epoxyqueuosine reductase